MESDKLLGLDAYLEVVDESVRTSRRASEIFFDMPDIATVVKGEQLIREDLATTYADFTHGAVVSQEPIWQIDNVRSEYWKRASRVTEISGAYVDASLDDYFVVDTERDESAIRASIRETYDQDSPPRLLLSGIEMYMAAMGMDAMEASRTATKLLARNMVDLKRYADEMVSASDLDSVSATREAFRYFVDFLVPEHIAQIASAGRSAAYELGDSGSITEQYPPLKLTAHDARGLAKVYKLERRPYSHDELTAANSLAKDPTIQALLINFQLAIVDYSKSYLDAHPERREHSLLSFSEIFVVDGDDYLPNPKLLKVLCNNYLPALAGIMIRDGRRGVATITEHDLVAAAEDAKARRVFLAQIAKYNNHDPEADTVELDAFIGRSCPGMRTVTEGLTNWMPRLLADAVQQRQPRLW